MSDRDRELDDVLDEVYDWICDFVVSDHFGRLGAEHQDVAEDILLTFTEYMYSYHGLPPEDWDGRQVEMCCLETIPQKLAAEDLIWAFPQPEPNPYQMEWVDLIQAIRENLPYNEAERGAMASLVTSMGRMAAHTGQVITLEQMMSCPHEFAPDVDKLTPEGPAPLQLGPDGRYPVPEPGIKKEREY